MDETLPACDTAGSDHQLSTAQSSASAAGTGDGHVVHVQANSGRINRTEVAAALALALEGGDGFEALVTWGATKQLLVLKKDRME